MTQPNPFQRFAQNKAAASGAAQPPAARPAPQPGPVGTLPAAARVPQPAQAGRYNGVKAATNKYPMPHPGDYLLQVIETYEKESEKSGMYFHADFEILESSQPLNPAGSKCTALQGTNPGKQFKVGGPKVKAFVMAAAGFDDEGAYNEFDPEGQFIDACNGVANRVYTDGTPIVSNPLAGRLVRSSVSMGNPVLDKKTQQPTGDFYREHSWQPVADGVGGEGGAAQ